MSKSAFNLGSLAAILFAGTAFGLCLWYDVMDPLELSVLSFVVVPPYLLLVACGLGIWLGFSTDAQASMRR